MWTSDFSKEMAQKNPSALIGWTSYTIRVFHGGVDAPWSHMLTLAFAGEESGRYAHFASVEEAEEYFRQGSLVVRKDGRTVPAPAGKYKFLALDRSQEVDIYLGKEVIQ